MSDLVIRGMSMPETCGLCKLCLDDSRICNGYCMFFHRRVNMMERDKNCPLLPLPEGHGRLVDAREVLEKADKAPWFDGDVAELGLLIGSEVTTIVPAERGGEDG